MDFFLSLQESMRLRAEEIPGITVHQSEENLRHFVVEVAGPTDVSTKGDSLSCGISLEDLVAPTNSL